MRGEKDPSEITSLHTVRTTSIRRATSLLPLGYPSCSDDAGATGTVLEVTHYWLGQKSNPFFISINQMRARPKSVYYLGVTILNSDCITSAREHG